MMLTFLMAHYKESEAFIKRALDSLENQEVDKNLFSVIIMNDGNEVVLNKNLFNDYSFQISYTIAPRSGTSVMRNRLLKEATSEYIYFLDSDDYLIDGSLEKVINILKDKKPDLLLCASLWEKKNLKTKIFAPDYFSYSILGCNIMNRKFLLKNNIWSDESVFLAGDIVLENIPKYYTWNRARLLEPVLYYTYQPKSAVHDMKNNGWQKERPVVLKHIIEKLIKDNKIKEAYYEYRQATLKLNSKYVHDAFVDYFKEREMYDMNYYLDLR